MAKKHDWDYTTESNLNELCVYRILSKDLSKLNYLDYANEAKKRKQSSVFY